MPSPFPGMDPYLEDAVLWQDVHLSLITSIRRGLQPQLVPRYYAHLGERIYIEEAGHAIYPDLTLVRRPEPERRSDGAVAVMAADEPRPFAFETRHREPYIEIRSASSHEVVTVIEVLSPANKSGGRGHEEYKRKQGQVLRSPASLVEIDLLRAGTHTVAVPRSCLPALGRFDYVVALYRGGVGGNGFEYDFTVRDRLPRVRIPLAVDDQDAVLDLPGALTQAYDEGVFDLRVDYSRAPAVALRPEEEAWADALLREKGLRTG